MTDPDPTDGPTAPADDDARRRVVEVVRAGHVGDAALARRSTADPDPAVRSAAIGALVRLAGADRLAPDDARDAVVAGLRDEVAPVRRRSAAEAARWGTLVEHPGASSARPLLDQLVAALADPDPRVAEVAAFAVGEVVPAVDALDDPTPATEFDAARRRAVDALIEVAVGHEEHLCREAAVAALGSIGDPAGLPAVLAGGRDRANVRRRAVLALAAFDGPEITAELERLTGDRDLQVRQAAEELLAIEAGETT